MKFNQLYYAVKISETHSFSQAAKELFITQPSLSQQIIKLEKELGVVLFERNGSSVKLTKAGENFVEKAKSTISSFETLQADMERFRHAGTDHIRIGVMRSVQYRYLVHELARIQREHPGIALSLFYDDSVELRQMLISGELDGAFLLPGDVEGIGDFLRWELPYRIYALVPPGNPLSNRTVLGLRDLDGQRLVFPGEDRHIFSALVHLLSQTEVQAEISLPHRGEPWLDSRSIAFISEGGHVPEALRGCELLPMQLSDLYGICLVLRGYLQENDLVSDLIQYFTR